MNGWTNWVTWNVALWISNDEALYQVATECDNYSDFLNWIGLVMLDETPDGASFTDPALNQNQLNALVADLC
jgi:hypothetical protein